MSESTNDEKLSYVAISVGHRVLDTAMTMVVSFLLIWILTVSDYAEIRVIQSAGGALVVFAHLGLPIAIAHKAAKEMAINPEKNPLSYLVVALVGTTGVFTISLILGPVILSLLGFVMYDYYSFLLYIIGIFFMWASEILQSYLSAIQEYKNLLGVQFFRTFIRPLLIPFSIVLFVFGYCLATFILGLFTILLALTMTLKISSNRGFSFKITIQELKESGEGLYSFGAQAFIPKVLRQMYIAASVLLLATLSNEAPAFFSVAYLILTLVLLFPYALASFTIPLYTSFYFKQEYEKLQYWYKEGALFIVVSSTAINLVLTLVPNVILRFFPGNYSYSIIHFPYLFIGGIFLVLLVYDSQVLHAIGNITPCIFAESIILISYFISYFMLITTFGEVSASLAFTISVGLGVFTQQAILQKYYSISFGIKRVGGVVFILLMTISFNNLARLFLVSLGLETGFVFDLLLVGSSLAFFGILSFILKLYPIRVILNVTLKIIHKRSLSN